MAKLGAFYALCPLIDNKSFFGVSQDAEEGIVITTLGKNMAGRYKVSNQKQISCWRTKDKFSSPVIYDVISSKYVSVFNKSFIRMWDKEVNLDKVKKCKFNIPIHTLFSKNGQSYVVFGNGALYRLEDTLEHNKTINPKKPDAEQIEDILYEQIDDDLYYGIIVKSEDTYLHWTKFENGRAKFKKIILKREEFTLAGCVFHQLENKMNLLTLWSDGALYSCPLDNIYSKKDGVGKLFSVIESVSTKYPVSMVSLDGNHLALYGANFNEEGAMFVIYNTQFKVKQSEQPFKLFTSDARMWHIENNVFVPVGQNLAVIPFQLNTATFADLVQSYRFRMEDLESMPLMEVVSDENGCKPKEKQLPKLLADKIDNMARRGLSEGTILDQLMPDIYENRDIELLGMCIKHFTDIDEKHMSAILKFVLDLDSDCFIDVNGGSDCILKGVLAPLQPSGRTKLIGGILSRPFIENRLIPPLRRDLSVPHLTLLFKYIYAVWKDPEMELPGLSREETEASLNEWLSVLTDANFMKIQLAKDESLREIMVLLKELMDQISLFQENEKTLNILRAKILRGAPKAHGLSSRYSVEPMTLY